MKKTFIILAFLTSFLVGLKAFSAAEPISKNGHSIRKLTLETDPQHPVANEDVNLTIKFILRSRTGISRTRVKLFINNGSETLSGENFTLTPNTDIENDDEKLEIYDGEITIKNSNFSRASNEFKLQYLLSSITPSSVLAQASVSKSIRGGSNNSGNGNGGNGGGGANGNNGNGFSVDPRLVSMFIEAVDFTENANGTVINTPVVSTNEQFFRLTVQQDQRLLDTVTEDTFNAFTNPVLKNLKIYKIDPNNPNEKIDITNGFTFSLEEESVSTTGTSSSDDQPLLETVYLSNGMVLKERQNLRFVIDLDNFYARSGVILEDNLITSDRDTIKIKAQESEVTDISLSEPITFNVSSSTKKNLTYTSNTVNLTGSFFSDNGSPSTIESVDFYLTKKGNKKTPKISAKKNHNLALKVFDTNGSSTVTSSNFTVPVSFNVTGSNGRFKSGGFYDPTRLKNFKIPFSITAKTDDDLDFILTGTLDQDSNAVFNAPVVVNGSSL